MSSAVPAAATLRETAFFRFWLARVLSISGFQIISVVIGWQIYALTGRVFDLGLAGLCQFLPMVVLTLPAGHAADRYDRRDIVRICQAIEASIVAALALASHLGVVTPPAIFAAAVLLGAARTFEGPATAALLPAIVPQALFSRAIALTASAVQTASIVGPALGGLLYIAGAEVTYGFTSLVFLSAVALVSSLRVRRAPARREPATMESLLSGFAFIRSQPAVLGAISLDMVAVLLGGATALLPVYASDILQTGSTGLGLLRAAPAAGALAMSLLLARFPLERRAGRKMFAAVGVFGLATVVFGLSTSFALSLAALLAMGASDVVSVVVRGSLVQMATPDAMRGRVGAVNSMFIGTSNQLGEFESGMTAALLGTVPAVVLGGIGTIATAIVWMGLYPQLRRVQSLNDRPLGG